MPSQRGSLVNGQSDPGYHFELIDKRARSASGYVDDYYREPDERSFICSKPGFVCAAAVVFTISFIALAWFIESGGAGLDFRSKNATNENDTLVSAAGFVLKPIPKSNPNDIPEDVAKPKDDDKRVTEEKPAVEDPEITSTTKPTSPPVTVVVTTQKPDGPTLYIYAPFEEESRLQSGKIKLLMDAHGYSQQCLSNSTRKDLEELFEEEIPIYKPKRPFSCQDLTQPTFAKMLQEPGSSDTKNSKYLFLLQDPRTLVYRHFTSGKTEVCADDVGRICMYDEIILSATKAKIEKWNRTASDMITFCERQERGVCRVIPIEKLSIDSTAAIKELAEFLGLGVNEAFPTAFKEMVQKIDEGAVAATPNNLRQEAIQSLFEQLFTDKSSIYPWYMKLQKNFYTDLGLWAPLMKRFGYGVDEDRPSELYSLP